MSTCGILHYFGEDGLIPARNKVDGGVAVHEYGLCLALAALCGDVFKGLRREFRSVTGKVFVAGLLTAAYGECGKEEYRWSYLSVAYPGLPVWDLTDKQAVGAGRCSNMAADILDKEFSGSAYNT